MKINKPKLNRKVMRRTFWGLVILIDLTGIYLLFHPDLIIMPFVNAAQTQQQSPQQPSKSKVVTAPIVTTQPAPEASDSSFTGKSEVVTPQPTKAVAPVQNTKTVTPAAPAPDCSPNATSQDPCKLGQCFGYPYGVCESNPTQTQKDQTPTDPNRPSYDLWGNEWTATGTLIHATCPNVKDPISGKDNPECVCPTDTAQNTWYIMGYDKTTNAAVCHIEYYNACPYSENVSADDPMCYKVYPKQ